MRKEMREEKRGVVQRREKKQGKREDGSIDKEQRGDKERKGGE